MAIIKRANYVRKFNNFEEITSTPLSGVNIVRNAEDDSLVVIDSTTGDSFQISDENTLTFEEILERLDQEGLTLGGENGSLFLGPRLQPINLISNLDVIRTGWFGYTVDESAELDIVRNGLLAYKFLPNQVDEVWATVKVPGDYVVGTSINFVVDWIGAEISNGNLVWGVEYSIADPSTNGILPQSELAIIVCDSQTTLIPQEYQTSTNKLDNENVIVSPDLKPGSVIHVRLFRNGVVDTCPVPIFLSNFNIEYTGKVL